MPKHSKLVTDCTVGCKITKQKIIQFLLRMFEFIILQYFLQTKKNVWTYSWNLTKASINFKLTIKPSKQNVYLYLIIPLKQSSPNAFVAGKENKTAFRISYNQSILKEVFNQKTALDENRTHDPLFTRQVL